MCLGQELGVLSVRREIEAFLRHLHVRPMSTAAARILIACVLFFAATAQAAEVSIVFRVIGGGTEEARVSLRRLDSVDDLRGEVAVQRTVPVTAPAVVDLVPGHWSLDVEGDEWWHERRLFHVGAEKAEVAATLWPAGFVSGSITAKREGDAISPELTARFEAADDTLEFPAGDVPCPVMERTFRCKLPAGALDLRLRPRGHLARYAWGVEVERGGTTKLPKFVLEKGASLAGTVELGRGERVAAVKPGEIRVTAIPVNAAAGVRGSDALLRYTATMGKRGHFHFDGLPPGRYGVQASAAANALLSEELEVVVMADTLAEMREPLRIEEPMPLRVSVVPAVDPWGEPWRVTLTRFSAGGGQDVAATAAVPESGTWSSVPLRSGKYELEVRAERGSTWDRRELEMRGDSPRIDVDLSSRRIFGTVTLGDRPLAAKIELSAGLTAIELQSGPDGKFDGYLPIAGREQWTAVVESREPTVEYRFPEVVPQQRDGAPGMELHLRVPFTTLHGELVNDDGAPVAGIVNVTSAAAGVVQTFAGDDGRFAVHGLPIGTHEVQGVDFLMESDVREVEVTEAAAPDPIRLVVHEQRKVPGRVMSDRAPVVGAEVYLYPTDVRQQMVGSVKTNERGVFSGTVSAGSRQMDVTVAAPGFDFRLFHTAVPPTGLEVRVDQRGGTIMMPAQSGDLLPYLQHAGATLFAPMIVERWYSRRVGSDSIAVSAMEPGAWSVCMARSSEYRELLAGRIDRAERCAEGFLAPYGTMTFARPRILGKKK
jgi:hypothetical protein